MYLLYFMYIFFFFFFQAEDGIRDKLVTGVQRVLFRSPALLPRLAPLWGLSNSEAGWVTAAFYGAYILAVPVLVTLTDRVRSEERRVGKECRSRWSPVH